MLERVMTRNRVVVRGLAIAAMAVSMAGLSALAQPGGGPGGGGPGGGLPPEVMAKVEAAEAHAVATSLKLDAEKAGKLSEAFSASRKAAAENRPEGGRGGDREAMMKAMEENRAKMQESFKAFLDEAQAKEAASLLAGNGRQWDRLVAVILGFGLDEAKQAQAMGYTLDYVKASIKAREDNAGAENFDGIRAAMVASKKTLDDAIAPLLNDAQKAEWAEKTSRGPRGGGNGGDERRRGGDSAPGAGAPPAPK